MKILQLLVGQMAVYSYVVGCEQTGEALLIDPAGEERQVVEEARRHGLTITKIVNTHGHPDHTCGNSLAKELTGAPILVHQDDAGTMVSESARQFAQMLGCAGTPPADQTIADGERIEVGREVSLEVIHTPGHSPGSICLYSAGHLFTGDTLFVGGVGRTDLPGGSWSKMLSSITNRILTLPDETIIWPGHDYGPSSTSTVKYERESNPYLR